MEPLHFPNSIKNHICNKLQTVEPHNSNKILDKYSSKNVPVPTQTLNIRVLSRAHLRLLMPLRCRRSRILNHLHQLLQCNLHHKFCLIHKFPIERQVVQHLQRRHLNRHTQIFLNRVAQSHLLLKDNQQLKVYRPPSKLPVNRVLLPSQLQTNSNSPRFQLSAVSTRGFC